jgi:3-deoxy-D-manno-octulosonic-acid transferase
VAGRLGEPIIHRVLKRREKRGKEDAARRGERFGRAERARPPGPLVWLHAASVGETVAVLPLIERLLERGPLVLLTTTTVTAAQIAERRLPRDAVHQYAPVDVPRAVDRFLDHWRPDLALFVESELWPTTLRAVERRGVPLAIVNARMSERSYRAWRALAPLARAMFGSIDLWLAQTPGDAERLTDLGAGRVTVCGNLKFDAPPPPADQSAVAAFRSAAAGRCVLLAASTHPGEEAAVVAAHAELAGQHRELLTIIAPRHPERGEALKAEIAAVGLRASSRSQGGKIAPDIDVYLADTIGEMGLWYRLADLAFLGGSMVPRGGQNPIEPAKLGVPVIHGPHVGNFRDVYDALAAANAVLRIGNADALAQAMRALIVAPCERERLARAALACVNRFTGALDCTLKALQPHIAALRHDHETVAGA